MTRTQVEQTVLQALAAVAPELQPASLRTDQPLRDQVDLDSMDFLRFVIELHKASGVEVAEADYPKLATIAGATEYVAARLGGR
jgi:acyl carrier protein